jgi:hypothetical protein
MSIRNPEEMFPAWRQRCMDDGLALVDNALASQGDASPPEGLHSAWQSRLRGLLDKPAGTGHAVADRSTPEAHAELKLVSDDEVDEGVLSQQLVKGIETSAVWPLGELQARCAVWRHLAEQQGFDSPVLLAPGVIAESLCLALRDCVPQATRRHRWLHELTPGVVRASKALFESQGTWLEVQGLVSAHGTARATGPAPFSDSPAPATSALRIRPSQVPAILANVAGYAGMDADMTRLMTALAAPIQRSLVEDPAMLTQADPPLWRFVDRLANLVQVDRVSLVPDETPLPVRLGPMMDAIQRSAAPLTSAHYERVLIHVEKLTAACMVLPSGAIRASEAALAAEERRAELEPWIRGQMTERLRLLTLQPRAREFLLGPWLQVLSRAGAVDGVAAPDTKRWATAIDALLEAADTSRAEPLDSEVLGHLMHELQAGMSAVGYSPAAVAEQTGLLREDLAAWPLTVSPAEASLTAGAVFGLGDAGLAESEDWMDDDWMHHGDLDTVPVGIEAGNGSPGSASSLRDAWLAALKAGDLCRIFLQGRWATARLDWVSDRQQFYKFSCHRSPAFTASRRMLARMRDQGLITTIQPGQWLRDAVHSLPVDLS